MGEKYLEVLQRVEELHGDIADAEREIEILGKKYGIGVHYDLTDQHIKEVIEKMKQMKDGQEGIEESCLRRAIFEMEGLV